MEGAGGAAALRPPPRWARGQMVPAPRPSRGVDGGGATAAAVTARRREQRRTAETAEPKG